MRGYSYLCDSVTCLLVGFPEQNNTSMVHPDGVGSEGVGKLDWGAEIGNYFPTENKFGNVFSCSMHIICAIIGIGVLALPSAISYLGWIAGPILLFVFYLVTVGACSMLASIYMVHGRIHSTYHYAVRDILGRKQALLLSSIQLAMFFLVNIAFSITGGLAIQQIANLACKSQGKTNDEIYNDQSCLGSGSGGTWQAILIFGATELVLSICIAEFSENAIGSTIGSICAGIYSLVAIIISFCNVTPGAGSLGGVTTSAANKVFGIFNALGQLGSAFGVSLILLEVQDTLAQPPSPVKQACKALTFSLSTCFVLYILVASSGYAAKGNDVAPVILDSFDNPRWALILAYCALLLNMLASFQIFAQALFDTVESNIKFWLIGRRKRRDGNMDALAEDEAGVVDEEGKQQEDADMTIQGSGFGFDCTCSQMESDLKSRAVSSKIGQYITSRGSHARSTDATGMESRQSSTIVQFATAPRVLTTGFANQYVMANRDGVHLPLWQRAIVRITIVCLQILIACVMPFFGAFVGLIGTVRNVNDVCMHSCQDKIRSSNILFLFCLNKQKNTAYMVFPITMQVNYFPLTIHFPFKMFQTIFKTSRRFDILLAVVWWAYVLITLVAAVGAVRTIVVGFSTYKIFGG